MNTGVGREGYSIIGQGKIAEIVSQKSEERRHIFEEAAGISKFRHRKEEAERKLKQTQDNLDRVKDILYEIEGRVGPLKNEAEKARRGLAIAEEKKRADVALWLYDTKKILGDIDEAEKAWMLSTHELEIIDQAISDLETQGNTLYEKAQSNRLASEELISKIRETDAKIHTLDNALQVAESDFKHSAELVGQCNSRIAEIEAGKQALLATRKEYQDNIAAYEATLQNLLDARLEYLAEQQQLLKQISEIKHVIQEALDELMVEEGAATDLKIRIDVLKNSKVSDNTKSGDVEREIAKYEKEGEALKEEADRCEENASEFKTKIAEKDDIIAQSGEKIDALSNQREQMLEKLNTLSLARDEALQRADVLQRMNDHFEGYHESVKFVMREFAQGKIVGNGKIYGPLSTLINVEKRYIMAIETALGNSLQNIVVDNEEITKAAINALKRANAGRATFYPISAMRPLSETDEVRAAASMPGYVARADKLVKTDDKYLSIIQFLLTRTVVFENIETASDAAKALKYRVKIVTIDGQLINAGGSYTGGSSRKESGILSRLTEISTLRDKAKELDRKIEDSRKELEEINSSVKAAQEALRDAEQEKELLLTLSRSQFAALDNANAKYAANRNIIEKLTFDYNNLIGQQSAAEEEIAKLTAEYNANLERIEALKAFRSNKNAEMGAMDERNDECAQKANELFIKETETRKDIESVNFMINDLDNRIAEHDADIDAQRKRIEELDFKSRNIDSVRAKAESDRLALEKELEELNAQRREVELGSDEFDREIAKVREQTKEKNASRQIIHENAIRNESNYHSLLEKQDKLGSKIWDEYELTYDDAIALDYPPVTEENREEVAATQKRCNTEIRKIGSYNPAAIEEYAALKERYDNLNGQYTDLTNSYEELTGIIARLEVEMRTSFIDAFEAINENFGITFRELFGGGKAELALSDPEDVLTSGIEIKVAPPGKIIKNLSLLSGGEQAFVAIALLFAILKVNPTPFCILDEIEAALDEVNVYRFGEYIKRLATDTQFILITHRRGTMEIGDRLYGVTMPQRGISQAIELNVGEIESKQKELLDGVL